MQQQQRNILHQVPVTIKAAGVYDLCGVSCSHEELSLALRRHHQPFLLGVKNGASPQNFLSTKTRRGADIGFSSPLGSAGCVCVCLGSTASVHDEIRATCQALWISSALMSRKPGGPQHSEPHTRLVSLGLLMLLKKGGGAGRLFYKTCFYYYFLFIVQVTGSWCMRVISSWTRPLPLFSKVNEFAHFCCS